MPAKKVEGMIHADGVDISVVTTVGSEDDYISLTDMASCTQRCGKKLVKDTKYNRISGLMGRIKQSKF